MVLRRDKVEIGDSGLSAGNDFLSPIETHQALAQRSARGKAGMAGHKIPGPQCQVRQFFADPVDLGTMARVATPSPGYLRKKNSRHASLSISHRELVIVRRETARAHHARLVQGKSKSDLHEPRGRIASIYFATDQSTLDSDDKAVLLEIYNTYQKFLSLRKVTFLFIGYADYRGTEKHNLELGRKRAQAVANYFSPLQTSPNYNWGVSSAGESETPQVGHTSSELSPYRRVDLIASPVLKRPVVIPEPKPPKPEPKSDYWKMRLLASGSGGGLGVGGSFFRLEIVDLNNHERIEYDYLGFGISAGYIGGAVESEWRLFVTSIPIGIRDFQGPARHTSLGVQAYKGISVDIIQLFGPTIHGADSVYEGWAGLWETGSSLSAGSDFGRLANPNGPYDVPRGYPHAE
jgi:outer membrane protein OmpA-like peptidoglycan-associated protein